MKKEFFLCLIALSIAAPAAADVAALRDQLLSPDPAVSTPALDQIAGLNANDKRLLVLSLATYLRREPAAARALTRCGPDAAGALPELLDALRMDDPEIARASAETLVKIGEPSVKPLIKVLSDPNFVLRQRAAEILAAIGPASAKAAPELVELLQDPQFQVQNAAQSALLKIGGPAVPALLDALKHGDAPARKQLIAFLPQFGAAATPGLVATLGKDDSPYVRVAAANGLGEIRPVLPTVVPALLGALKSTDDNVRTAAVNALGRLGTDAKAAIGPLIVAAHMDSEALVQQRSPQALQQIGVGSKESLPGFLDGIRAKDASARKDILVAAGQADISADDLAALLALAVKDPDTGVRLQAIQVAAARVPKEAKMVPILHSAVQDESANRTAAILALGEAASAPGPAAEALEDGMKNPSMSTKQTCVLAMARLGPPAIPVLLRAMTDSSSIISEEAENAVLQMGSAAVPVLERMKGSQDLFIQKKSDELITRITGRPSSRAVAPAPAAQSTHPKKKSH